MAVENVAARSSRHQPTFVDLRNRIEQSRDKNFPGVLSFIEEALSARPHDGLDQFFGEDTLPGTRATLFEAARKRWPNKGTMKGNKSRVTKIIQDATFLLAERAISHESENQEVVQAVALIFSAIALRWASPGECCSALFPESRNWIYALQNRTRKFPAGTSKKLIDRLGVLSKHLGLDPDEIVCALVAPARSKNVSTRLKPAAFVYGMRPFPADLQNCINEITNFHKFQILPKNADGSPKVRLKNSTWKQKKDGTFSSEGPALDNISRFFGYLTLPCSENDADRMVAERLKTTKIAWRTTDLSIYRSWMTGEGMSPDNASIAWLLEPELVGRFVAWQARRNDGASATQSSLLIMLRAWTNTNGAITQSYVIASKVLGFPALPDRPLTANEAKQYRKNMERWKEYCAERSAAFLELRMATESSKVPRKAPRLQKHEALLALPDPLAPIHEMIENYCKSEPIHLPEGALSRLVWARNMALLVTLVSNPVRAENISILTLRNLGQGHLSRDKSTNRYEIRFAPHEVKNPPKDKTDGYRAPVSTVASLWLDYYLHKVLPRWPGQKDTSGRVFLTQDGNPLTTDAILNIVVEISSKYLPGYVPINTHLFRHLVATSWLKSHPDDFLTAALILGDTLETVMKTYAHLASQDGVRRYHEVVDANFRALPPSGSGL